MNKQHADNILKQIKKRTQPDVEKQQAAKQAVMAHWQSNLKKQRSRRLAWGMGIAASTVIMFAMVLFVNLNPKGNQLDPMYQQVSTHGTVMHERRNSDSQLLTTERSIEPGDLIHSTDNSYVIWHLNDGSELTQAPQTSIVWHNSQHIKLLKGQLYHNTDMTEKSDNFVISTDVGSVRHIGTQYVVNRQSDALQVAVKSGAVNIDTNNRQHTLKPNELMSITNTGAETIQSFTGYDHPMWSWTFKTQQPYALKGQSLYDFVVWISQQADLTVDWQGQQQATQGVLLQGTIDKMSVDMALKTVFASTDYQYQIDQGRLQIIHQDK